MASQPTMRELAALAGCSLTTVSLALRGHPRISAATRERIMHLAEENGYTRDPVIATLMNQLRSSRKTRVQEKIALLTWWDKPGAKQNERGVELYEGIRERSRHLGYEIEEFWAREPRMTGMRLSQILYTRAIRGILLLSMLHARGRASFQWERFAAATVSHTIVQPRLHRAATSHFHAMMIALRNLKRLGYTRVGYVNVVEQEDMNDEAWLAAYMAHQFRTYACVSIPPLLLQEAGDPALANWLEQHKPDAVISSLGDVLTHLGKLGYRVPADIGFACLDVLPGVDPWAGVDGLRREVGARAIDLVIEQLQNNELGLPERPKTVTVEGVWHDGPTLPARRG